MDKRKKIFACLLVASATLFSTNADAQGRQKQNQGQKKQQGQGGGGNAKLSPAPVLPGNIVLGSPSYDGITANLILDPQQEAFLEYGTEPGKYPGKTAVIRGSAVPIEIVIKGLKPNTRYYYRLNMKQAGEKKFSALQESWFATQRSKSSSFSFGVQGDSHPEREGKMFSPALYRQTLAQVAQRKPDFYFMMGDDFNIDRLVERKDATSQQVEAVYLVQRHYLGNTGSNPPLFLVNGNHEQAARYLLDGTPNNAAIQAGLARKKYFPLPGPRGFYSGDADTVQHVGLLKDYYAFEWGNALFVVIDPYWHSDAAVDNQPGEARGEKRREPGGATLGKTQYDWLKKTLEESKAVFKFVFAHHVNGTGRGGVERAKYFEWGGYGQNGRWEFDRYRPGWEMPIHQLMVKNKVTIFFQGHDHLFARQELDGVIYQSVPNPADDTHTAFNNEAYTTGTVLPNSGFLNVTVDTKEVKVEYVRSFLGITDSLPREATEPFTYTVQRR
jgi:hypothetical protein